MTVWEPYRVITDLEALVDGFIDRIDDLDTTLEQVELAAGMAKGQLQKCLARNPGKAIARPRDHRSASNQRKFGWESLGKALKGTGLALVLVVDDARFSDTKAQLMKRRRRQNEMLPAGSMKLLRGKITPKISKKLQLLRTQKLSPQQRRRIARFAARSRWKNRRKDGCEVAKISSDLVVLSS